MKVKVCMKNPDSVYCAIKDALEGITDEGEREEKRKEIETACSEWFKYDEYLTVVVDTETKTCEVVRPQ